jgi:hypothetical protein
MPDLSGLLNMAPANMFIHGGVVLAAAAIAITSFALLIPLDSVPAVTGVTIILTISYCIAFIAWAIVMYYYSKRTEDLVWLNTHLLFLVVLPATVAATAMNVTSIQNTRNLLAGKVTG